MAYTPATKLPSLYFFQWATPNDPAPSLNAPISATATTLIFSVAPVDHNGTAITGGFLMGVKSSTGYVENIYVPTGAISGTTATGVVRGVRLEGLDYTTGDSTLAIAHSAGEQIFCNITGVFQAISNAVLQGTVASGGANLIIGTDALGTTTISRSTGTGTYVGFLRWLTGTTKAQFSNDGASWVNFDSVSASNLVQVSAADTTPSYLDNKLTTGDGLSKTITNPGANEVLDVDLDLTDTTVFVSSSSGAGDSGKIARLNASGVYPAGFLGTGTADVTKVLRGDNTWGGTISNIYGDGNDGTVTISGPTTLTRDMYYNSLTVDVGQTLTTGGYRVFVKETLTNNGNIQRNGNNGGGGSNGNAGSAGQFAGAGGAGGAAGTGGAGGAAGSSLSSGSLYGALTGAGGKAGTDGKTGGNGQVNAVGLPGTAGTAGASGNGGSAQTEALGSAASAGVAGTAGGGGGNGGASNVPFGGGTGGAAAAVGAAGAAGSLTAAITQPRQVTQAVLMIQTASTTAQLKNAPVPGGGGAGGGSGSGGAGGGIVGSPGGGGGGSGGGGGGGGSGSSGGTVLIAAKTIVNSATGVIQANGGTGGNGGAGGAGGAGGSDSGGANSGAGGGGGGGAGGAGGAGGNGGTVVIIYNSLTNNGTIQAAGGAGGTGGSAGAGGAGGTIGAGAGNPGTAGTNGTAGNNGNSGAAGTVFQIQIN